MKKLAVALVIVSLAAVIAGCGATAEQTGSTGSYNQNPTTYK